MAETPQRGDNISGRHEAAFPAARGPDGSPEIRLASGGAGVRDGGVPGGEVLRKEEGRGGRDGVRDG